MCDAISTDIVWGDMTWRNWYYKLWYYCISREVVRRLFMAAATNSASYYFPRIARCLPRDTRHRSGVVFHSPAHTPSLPSIFLFPTCRLRYTGCDVTPCDDLYPRPRDIIDQTQLQFITTTARRCDGARDDECRYRFDRRQL